MKKLILGSSIALLSLANASCRAPAVQPTELIVFVESDLMIGPRDPGVPVLDTQIQSIRFRIECIANEGDPPCDLGRGMSVLDDAFVQQYTRPTVGTAPPFYFVLLRDRAGLPRTIRVTATATLGEGTAMTLTARAEGATVEGEIRVMTLALRSECIGSMCGATETCSLGGGCAPALQSPLLPWTGQCESVRIPGFTPRACAENMFQP
jgi:hypothetical protein